MHAHIGTQAYMYAHVMNAVSQHLLNADLYIAGRTKGKLKQKTHLISAHMIVIL